MDMAQYNELVTFAQFGTADLDAATRQQLERGQRTTEVLKQPQYQPLTMAQQVSILYAVLNGYLDDVPVEKVQEFESEFHTYMEGAHSAMLAKIMETKDLDDATTQELVKAIEGFKATTSY